MSLQNHIADKKTGLCVGIDPDPLKIPSFFFEHPAPLASFTKVIIEAVSAYAAAIKPNFAFYEAEGIEGLLALKHALESKPKNLFLVGDVKRADIGNSSRFYAKSFFDYWHLDAVTVPPYMGYDSIEPFLEREDKLTFILCLTSNAGSLDFEEQPMKQGEFLYETVMEKALTWNKNKNIGLVVGSTKPHRLTKIQSYVGKDVPLLIPGLGSQGMSIQDLVDASFNFCTQQSLFNQSRSIIYPEGKFNSLASFQAAVELKAKAAMEELLTVTQTDRA